MKFRPTQFGVRENTASSRQHAPRLTVDSLPSMSEALPRDLQYRYPTPAFASPASESDMSIITMPLEAATGGERGDSAEPIPAPTGVITAKESRRVLLTPEPFVSADEAAQFLCVKRRYLLELARRASPEHMRSAQGANAESGCFGSRNSPPLSYGMRPRFQNHQNGVRSDLAVPAEKRTMAYQRGSLKKVRRKEGETWVLRYRVTSADGRRVEHIATIGLVRDFPKDRDAWREVDRLGLGVRINDTPAAGRASFYFLAEHYLKADFGADAVRPKSANTIPIVEHYVRDYLIKRFGERIAEDIKPLEIQRWLKSLNEMGGLAWARISSCGATCTASTRSASCTNASRRIVCSTSRRVPSPPTGQSSALQPRH